jgi:hypothetical protein
MTAAPEGNEQNSHATSVLIRCEPAKAVRVIAGDMQARVAQDNHNVSDREGRNEACLFIHPVCRPGELPREPFETTTRTNQRPANLDLGQQR